MKTTAKPTPGPWSAGGTADGDPDAIVDPDGFELAYINQFASSHGNGEHEANAALIAEAGTVYHETGLSPREILAQRDELLERLDTLTLVVGLTPISGNKEALQEAMNAARSAIQNASKGGEKG